MVYHVFDEKVKECANPWDCNAVGKHCLTIEEGNAMIEENENNI